MRFAGAFVSIVVATSLIGCISDVRRGQRLFAGCPDGVDDYATIERGTFVCEGAREPTPFGGNGRSCGDCHMPGDNFGISMKRIGVPVPPVM